MFENPRRGWQARNFTTNVSKILDLKSSSEQISFRKLSLGAPVFWRWRGQLCSGGPGFKILKFSSQPLDGVVFGGDRSQIQLVHALYIADQPLVSREFLTSFCLIYNIGLLVSVSSSSTVGLTIRHFNKVTNFICTFCFPINQIKLYT